MSKVICIAGESGSGKTTSMRNLSPDETYYFDCDLKGLNWKGWRNQYNSEKKNYFATTNIDYINKGLAKINERKEIKYVIIDTINSIMADDEMRRSKEKGYDKWIDLASCVWELISNAYRYREDLTIIFVAHTQTEADENGSNKFTRIKTNGKKLNKLCLESRLSTIIIAKIIENKHVFEVKANNSTAKVPMGAFAEDVDTIENDITILLKALEEF